MIVIEVIKLHQDGQDTEFSCSSIPALDRDF